MPNRSKAAAGSLLERLAKVLNGGEHFFAQTVTIFAHRSYRGAFAPPTRMAASLGDDRKDLFPFFRFC